MTIKGYILAMIASFALISWYARGNAAKVDQIAQAFGDNTTPGIHQSYVWDEGLRDLVKSLASTDRQWPLVLSTPLKSGGYSVDLEKLRARLVGWASLHVVPEAANFAQFQDVLGPEHYCFNGAIKVIMPISSAVEGALSCRAKTIR